MVAGGLLKRHIGCIAVGLAFIASSCGLIGIGFVSDAGAAGAATPQAKPTTTTTAAGGHTTTSWKGNGTTGGFCDDHTGDQSGIPAGDQGWQFVLTSPDPGPWELTATFANSGTISGPGTQNGNHGSVHFEVISSLGDRLLSASSTNGGNNLVVGSCTLGASTTTTTACPYGPCTSPTTFTPTTVKPVVSAGQVASSPATAGSNSGGPTAFTGADLALMFTIGAAAVGVGGMLVLVARRRRRSGLAHGGEDR